MLGGCVLTALRGLCECEGPLLELGGVSEGEGGGVAIAAPAESAQDRTQEASCH